jgi:hypothetical protein
MESTYEVTEGKVYKVIPETREEVTSEYAINEEIRKNNKEIEDCREVMFRSQIYIDNAEVQIAELTARNEGLQGILDDVVIPALAKNAPVEVPNEEPIEE